MNKFVFLSLILVSSSIFSQQIIRYDTIKAKTLMLIREHTLHETGHNFDSTTVFIIADTIDLFDDVHSSKKSMQTSIDYQQYVDNIKLTRIIISVALACIVILIIIERNDDDDDDNIDASNSSSRKSKKSKFKNINQLLPTP